MASGKEGSGPPTPLDFEQAKELLAMQFEQNMAMLDKLVEIHNMRTQRNEVTTDVNLDDVLRAAGDGRELPAK